MEYNLCYDIDYKCVFGVDRVVFWATRIKDVSHRKHRVRLLHPALAVSDMYDTCCLKRQWLSSITPINLCGSQHYQGSHILDNYLAHRSFHGTEQGTCVQQL